ncbi:hypothetical protein F5884DRAFT_890652 [Xylogone sp. PMI_703]|nr:hypothetical protein F5884DRAFT_890652 [Xylogone sp. PMI_703]
MSAENQANPQLTAAILQVLKDFGAPAPAGQLESHHPNRQQPQTVFAEARQPPHNVQHPPRHQSRPNISPQHPASRSRAQEIDQVSKFNQICLKLDQQMKEQESLRGLIDQVSTKLDRVALELGQVLRWDVIGGRVKDGRLEYYIDWGHPYTPSWEPREYITEKALLDWEKKRTMKLRRVPNLNSQQNIKGLGDTNQSRTPAVMVSLEGEESEEKKQRNEPPRSPNEGFPSPSRLLYKPDTEAPNPAEASNKGLEYARRLIDATFTPEYRYAETVRPFLQPVDPIADGIPDYLVVIKRPMDFSTIQKTLHRNMYKNTLEIKEDLRQVFKNC